MKILSVASARPNFVKLAAVHHAFEALKQPGDEHIIVHTGQHYDPLLSDVFFEQLNIGQPKHNLGIKGGSDREAVIQATAEAIEPVLAKEQPDFVLVYGDVNGALGGAQAAKQLGIKLAHIEAGLRSGDMDMPEEHNRIAIDKLADTLFVTEQSGLDHLKEENVSGEAILVGNTMIDTLLRNKALIETLGETVLKALPQFPAGKFAIATIHRPSNVDDPAVLQHLIDFLSEVSAKCPIILPAHPRLKAALQNIQAQFLLLDPLPYFHFMGFMRQSAFILTDSGGIQEEAVLLGKRCFTLRRNTERPSTIASGSNVLIDPNVAADRKQVLDFAANPKDPSVKIPEKWDGKAGERIINVLRSISA